MQVGSEQGRLASYIRKAVLIGKTLPAQFAVGQDIHHAYRHTQQWQLVFHTGTSQFTLLYYGRTISEDIFKGYRSMCILSLTCFMVVGKALSFI